MNTHYEQGRLHCFQQPARPFRVECKQENATQTFPQCLCLWPGAVPDPSCYQNCRVCSSCTACSPTKSTVSLSSPLSPPAFERFTLSLLPMFAEVIFWGIILYQKTQCWLQIKTCLYFSNLTMSTSRFW